MSSSMHFEEIEYTANDNVEGLISAQYKADRLTMLLKMYQDIKSLQ